MGKTNTKDFLSKIKQNIAPTTQTPEKISETPVVTISSEPANQEGQGNLKGMEVKKVTTLPKRNHAVHLPPEDEAKLGELDFWLRGQNIKASENAILRAGLRSLSKDFKLVELIRAIKEEDARKRRK